MTRSNTIRSNTIKNNTTRKNSITGLLLATLFLSTYSHTYSSDSIEKIEEVSLGKPQQAHLLTTDTDIQNWAFAMDNDIFVPGSRDQDYTYGLNLSFSGDKARQHIASAHRPLNAFNRSLGLMNKNSAYQSSKIEYGLFGFTPEDISQESSAAGDRPYASLVYVSSTTEQYQPWRETSWNSTLTIGILGVDVVGELQQSVHALTNGDEPMGWDSQVSDGGELTARYNISQQRLISKRSPNAELKSTLQASIGYITEASWSLSSRLGKLHSPWVSFNPELTSYGEKASPAAASKLYEHYLWAGVSVKARAYNAFLQGQFRDSDVEYDSGDLNHTIIEAWLGYTFAYRNGFSFTYSLRGHSSELKEGVGDRSVVWGGLQFTQALNR